ncbi:recombinase zinc beta ribbon domain-containing protein [Bremerella sp. T1]|uniref:recombinase zinc beta ribbon domain-containing protein n=1 Tax=Bremerella sp. TYQ1 TaxID=3119568 RepID=UPI001CCA6230|nr:recombinase zinc beta ribbon domain-containing protein [Bremerella volcania]UBM38959.1 hypothetical protein LA756_21245 [Bremerella volcania]
MNAPTAGRIPFGRIWNKKTSTWSVDEAKKRIVEEVASRYLSGESLKDLAEEHKINHSFLHKTLTKNCGCSHTIRWNIPDLNIDTSVVLTIPRLLPEKTIKAIQTKAKANRTYQHGCPKNPYLLTGYIFCTCCGYALSGQANRNGLLYYRHYPPSKGVKVDCPADPSPYPRAEEIESSVIKELFLTFGNPAAVERALNKMMPDQEKAQKQRDQIAKLKNELEQIRLGRAKVMDMAVLGIPDHEIKSKIEELNGQEALIARKISELSSHLDGLPSKEQILDVAQEIGKRFRKKVSAKRWMMMMDAEDFDHMEWADKRALIEAVFASDQPDGRPMGIYLSALPGQKRHRSKRWIFELFGMIPNFRGMPEYSDGANPLEGFVCVTRSASHSPKPFLPERHFR